MFNATFNNISVISVQSVLLMEKTRVPRENHRPGSTHWQTLLHNVSSTPIYCTITTMTPPPPLLHNVSSTPIYCTITTMTPPPPPPILYDLTNKYIHRIFFISCNNFLNNMNFISVLKKLKEKLWFWSSLNKLWSLRRRKD